ncbi:hypothetical protein OPV22_029989 [Ensete ventricosum]|uniref:DOMON domain-containing protein n=1 Tax=Ensete ventricosum TaxID=4639 RepID=A0AAV8Q2M4_ENSVE|nr:hypothetical protein OPV22_029989 [Ensete ventricosum]
MEMKRICSSFIFFLFLLCFTSFVNTQSDSCSSKLGVGNLIPFNTSSLTCVSAWSSQGLILRYTKAGQSLWSFVLSAPDTGAYVAIGFSPDGKMVGSSAVAGWTPSGGAGIVKQYYLGGYSSSQCPPDQGSLPLVQGSSLLASQNSRLYLAFQLNTAQPRKNLIYAVGPSNTLPPSGGSLASHRDKASGTLTAPARDVGGGGDDSGEEGDDHEGGGGGGGGENPNGGGHREGGGGNSTESVGGHNSARKHALLTAIALLPQIFFS